MKKIVEQELNRYNSIESEDTTYIAKENMPKETSELAPEQGSVELVGEGGLRVKWDYSIKAQDSGCAGTIVEELKDGKWAPVTFIQKLVIEFDVDRYIPKVTMERFMVREFRAYKEEEK